MKKVIKKIIILVLYYSGLNWLVGKFSSSKVFCVGYHSIWDENNKEEFAQKLYWNISVNTLNFEKQLLFMKNNRHTFIHFSDLDKPEIKRLNKPTILFFDDGFKDVLINALPILKKHNIPATVFITTGLTDRTHFLWTLGVRYFMDKNGVSGLLIEKKIRELKKLPMKERDFEIAKMFSSENFMLNPSDFDIFLNWDEVIQLSKNNFEIGSHGVVHQKITELSEDELRHELTVSKAILEDKISSSVMTFSYPYGRYNDHVIKMTMSSGYSLAVSTVVGSNSFEYIKQNSFQLKRINPEEDKTLTDFKVRLYTNI